MQACRCCVADAGRAQAIAIVPGISRSGSTITAGLLPGVRRSDVARFSLLIGMPIIAGAGTKQLVDMAQAGLSPGDLQACLVGMLVSALIGCGAIWGLLRCLQRASTLPFIVCRLLFAVMVVLVVAIRWAVACAGGPEHARRPYCRLTVTHDRRSAHGDASAAVQRG